MRNPFKKKQTILQVLEQTRHEKTRVKKKEKPPIDVEETLYTKCPSCQTVHVTEVLEKHLFVCPKCANHLHFPANKRLQCLFDHGKYKELNISNIIENPLGFPEYEEKKSGLRAQLNLKEAAIASVGKIGGHTCVVCALDSRFIMASMSVYVGELITQAIEYAEKKKLPLVIFNASGGARMQEGIFALMQMAKTSCAIERFSNKGGLFISYFTHPTTGGVSASFAGLGDITLAEPDALIGFAGPRVIKETIKQELPIGFQKSEYLLQHGFIDEIVARDQMKRKIEQILLLHGPVQLKKINREKRTYA